MKYFDTKHDRIIFTDQPTTTTYWDKQWANTKNLAKELTPEKNPNTFRKLIYALGGRDNRVRVVTKKFLPASHNIKILDGGCGKGQHVAILNFLGYSAYGIDNAPEIIKNAKSIHPELKLIYADVQDIPFKDNYFDGYWSLGVIEHFWDGYDKTTKEMTRVIKPNGYLFLVFPHISILRRIKINLGLYKKYNPNTFNKNKFFQFALNTKEIQNHFKKLNFRLVYIQKNSGLKGLKYEIPPLASLLQHIYDSNNPILKTIKVITNKILTPISNHTITLVFQKKKA